MDEIYVIKIDPNLLESLEKLYNGQRSENPYMFFKAFVDDITIEGYTSGKIVYRGKNPLSLIYNLPYAYSITKYPNSSQTLLTEAIGSDEVGTGDFFGPVVVATLYVNKDEALFLKKLGISDSKTLTDSKIIDLALKIKDKLTYTVLIINNDRFNNATQKGNNMNRIKAVLHNKAILDTIKKVGKREVILDQFCEPYLYFNYLKDVPEVFKEITFKTKAEKYHIAVAGASILARYTFLNEMKKLSTMIGFDLALGAGEKVDEQITFLLENNPDVLPKIAKINFKNLTRIKEKKND